MGILIPLLVIVFACLVIWRACDGFELASKYLGRNLSEGVRGGTINAISSSIPELLTTLIALLILADRDGFSVGLGTTAGSALFNGMIIPAACILFVVGRVIAGIRVDAIEVSVKVLLRDGVALVVSQILLIVLLQGDRLSWWHGLVLMLTYGAYLWYMLRSMRRGTSPREPESDDEAPVPERPGGFMYWASLGPLLDLPRWCVRAGHRARIAAGTWNAWPLLAVSTAVISAACALLVKACEWLGTGSEEYPSYEILGAEFVGLGMPPLFVAVIFASMATSVPDTVISIRDARKGDYDDAVANAVGSNVFDICFALGFPLFLYGALFGEIVLTPEAARSSSELRVCLLLLSTAGIVVYLAGSWQRRGATRVVRMAGGKAWSLLALYLLFVLFVVGRSMDADWALRIADWLDAVSAAMRFPPA